MATGPAAPRCCRRSSAAGAALMLLAAVGGADYLNNRNTSPVLAIVLAVPALGFAAGRAGRGAGGCRLHRAAAATIGALIDPAHAREDWRGAARDLRAPGGDRGPAPTSRSRSAGTRPAAPGADGDHPRARRRPTGGVRPQTPTGFLPGKTIETAGSGSPATPRRPRSRRDAQPLAGLPRADTASERDRVPMIARTARANRSRPGSPPRPQLPRRGGPGAAGRRDARSDAAYPRRRSAPTPTPAARSREAGQRRVLLRQVGRRAERLVVDLGAAVVGRRAARPGCRARRA